MIDRLGIDAVNASIRNLGCAHTVLGRKMLDFEARRRGLDNYTCARETGELLVRMAQVRVRLGTGLGCRCSATI